MGAELSINTNDTNPPANSEEMQEQITDQTTNDHNSDNTDTNDAVPQPRPPLNISINGRPLFNQQASQNIARFMTMMQNSLVESVDNREQINLPEIKSPPPFLENIIGNGILDVNKDSELKLPSLVSDWIVEKFKNKITEYSSFNFDKIDDLRKIIHNICGIIIKSSMPGKIELKNDNKIVIGLISFIFGIEQKLDMDEAYISLLLNDFGIRNPEMAICRGAFIYLFCHFIIDDVIELSTEEICHMCNITQDIYGNVYQYLNHILIDLNRVNATRKLIIEHKRDD